MFNDGFAMVPLAKDGIRGRESDEEKEVHVQREPPPHLDWQYVVVMARRTYSLYG